MAAKDWNLVGSPRTLSLKYLEVPAQVHVLTAARYVKNLVQDLHMATVTANLCQALSSRRSWESKDPETGNS
jgi:hypothetical protein